MVRMDKEIPMDKRMERVEEVIKVVRVKFIPIKLFYDLLFPLKRGLGTFHILEGGGTPAEVVGPFWMISRF